MQALVKQTSSSQTLVGARAALSFGLARIFEGLPHGRGWASYPFNTLTLQSHFQPIFHADTGRALGYEGLLHATNLTGQSINPETVFALSYDSEQELFLDWLCRALHMRNFANLGSHRQERGLLFLNAYPQAAVEDPYHPEVFQSMMEFYGVDPRDVVIEILETGASDDAHLVDAANLYRRLGCKIAIDDFGVGFSNFERLWRLKPDFVKIDRSVLKSAMQESHARVVFASMIRLIKNCGAAVVIEGIEERAEAKLAIELGADYLQGFYFAKPAAAAFPFELGEKIVSQLWEEQLEALRQQPRHVEAYVDSLTAAAQAMQAGQLFGDAVEKFISQPNAVRAYLVHDKPDQQASQLVVDMTEDQAWLHLPTPDSGVWRVRNLYERALSQPNVVQIATPLLIDRIPPAPTLTMSIAFTLGHNTVVLCGDVLVSSQPVASTDTAVSASNGAPINTSTKIIRLTAEGAPSHLHM